MRSTTFSLAFVVAIFSTSAAMAAPVYGSFSGVVSAADLATFSGDILGTPASAIHEGDLVSGTFSYNPATMTPAVLFPGFAYSIFNGPIAFDFKIGSHEFSFSGQGPNSDVAMLDPAIVGAVQYFAAARQYDGNFNKGFDIDVGGPGPLYSDAHDLTSVQFQNMPAILEFAFSETDPFSSGTTTLGYFSIAVHASVPVATTPVPASALLFLTGIAGLGLTVARKAKPALIRNHAA